MTELKYKLIRAGRVNPNVPDDNKRRYFRLQALRDIPEHGVKEGDLGGYVTGKKILSHEGSCWIGGEAQVVGDVFVIDDAYVGGQAFIRSSLSPRVIVIKDKAKIYDNASIISYTGTSISAVIKDEAEVYGNAVLQSVFEVSGTAKIYGEAFIKENSIIMGNSTIYGNAVLNQDCRVIDTIVNGFAEIGVGDRIRNGKLDTSGINGSNGEIQHVQELEEYVKTQKIYIQELEEHRNFHASKVFEQGRTADSAVQSSEYLDFFHEITASIDSYATDIVKIIKYPAMVDPSVPETLAMTVARKKASRLSRKPESEEFAVAVAELEEKFILAEAQSCKLASTLLSDDDKKKTRKASDLLRIASDDASSEHEKKVAFVQGFKQLEGVIAVPEIAVDAFRVKIGLKELEASDALQMDNGS